MTSDCSPLTIHPETRCTARQSCLCVHLEEDQLGPLVPHVLDLELVSGLSLSDKDSIALSENDVGVAVGDLDDGLGSVLDGCLGVEARGLDELGVEELLARSAEGGVESVGEDFLRVEEGGEGVEGRVDGSGPGSFTFVDDAILVSGGDDFDELVELLGVGVVSAGLGGLY